jgi:hypothetical protein
VRDEQAPKGRKKDNHGEPQPLEPAEARIKQINAWDNWSRHAGILSEFNDQSKKVESTQPRSGERMQPTAQAVGKQSKR